MAVCIRAQGRKKKSILDRVRIPQAAFAILRLPDVREVEVIGGGDIRVHVMKKYVFPVEKAQDKLLIVHILLHLGPINTM